ncbi:MAG: hypothetical protein N3F09_11020, partial [Bacteroidia bacterium]|nr:hypothetical protein [Bacteroidia bacterium]
GWKGSVRENSISEGYKPAVNIYFGKKERFFVIPFFFFEWNKGDYAISFDFASACETYDKIDFINYKIIFNTNTGQSEISGSIIGGNKGFFKCYSDYGYYGKSTRCYAMLKSEYNIKQLMADPIHINVDFDVYITDKNKQGVMLKYRDSKLSIVKESKVKFFIIENY